ncbi:MAG: four helix bundle protein [Clostridiales bacterium]|nr:four helix bundle protein [Clostridiales bacterium]
MTDSVLRSKSKGFAKEIVLFCRKMKQQGVESALLNQLLRSGTSVGANIHEAQGTKDFISKFEIALKECNESEYWIELLYDVDGVEKQEFERLTFSPGRSLLCEKTGSLRRIRRRCGLETVRAEKP